jgi:hypothetical protein
MELDYTYALLAVKVLLYIAIIPIACFFDNRLHKRNPALRLYTWGYFLGIAGVVSSVLISLFFFCQGSLGLPIGLFFLAIASPFWFIIKRRKWAWIIGSILSLNPFIMVANYFYAKKRWHEFG